MSHRALRIYINMKYLGREAALEGQKTCQAKEQDDCTVLKSRRRPSISLNQVWSSSG